MKRVLKLLGLLVLASLPSVWLLIEGRPGAVLITDGFRELETEDWRRASRFIWEELPEVEKGDLESVSGSMRSPLDGQLYFSARDRNGWDLFRLDDRGGRRPERLIGLSSPDGDRDAKLSVDGRRLYFSSDRAGGAGGYDIWVSRWQGDDFGTPERVAVACGAGDDRRPTPRPEGGFLFLRPQEEQALVWLSGETEGARLAVLAAPWSSEADVAGVAVARDGRLFFSAREGGSDDYDLYRALPEGRGFGPGRKVIELATSLDEIEPACDAEGLGFCREGGEAPAYEATMVRAREREIESRALGMSLRAAVLKALLALVATLLALLLILRWRKLHPFFKFLLVSLIIHLLAMLFVDPIGAPGEGGQGQGRALRVTWLGDDGSGQTGSGAPVFVDSRDFVSAATARVSQRPDSTPETAARALRSERDGRPDLTAEMPDAVSMASSSPQRRPAFETTSRASLGRAAPDRVVPQGRRAESSRAESPRTVLRPDAVSGDSGRVTAEVGLQAPRPGAKSIDRLMRAAVGDLEAEIATMDASTTETVRRGGADSGAGRPRVPARVAGGAVAGANEVAAGAQVSDRVDAGSQASSVLVATPGSQSSRLGEESLASVATGTPGPRRFRRSPGPSKPSAEESSAIEVAGLPRREAGAIARRSETAAIAAGSSSHAESIPGPGVEAPDFGTRVQVADLGTRASARALVLGTPQDDATLHARSFRRPRATLVMPDRIPEVPAFAARTGVLKARALELGGGGVETEAAVLAGLRYLAKVQNRDGSWGTNRRHSKYRDRRAGKTGLALLAFLGAGHDHLGDDEFREVVARGLGFLLSAQSSRNGHIGDGASYGHGIATYAMAEAHASTGDDDLRAPLRRALNRILGAQHRDRGSRLDGGWGYYYRDPNRRYDDWPRLSVTVWQIMALESGRLGGLHVPDSVLERARRFVLNCDDAGMGALRYNHDPNWRRSSYPTLPGSNSAALFAMQLLDVPEDHPAYSRALDFVSRRPPSFSWRKTDNGAFVRRGDANLYFHYYAALALHRRGGEDWAAWNARLKPLLLDNQQQDGSWRPISAYAEYAGDDDRERSYTTTMAVLMLEVYYRYFTPLLADHEASAGPSPSLEEPLALFELTGVRAGGAAERAGLREGDGLIELDGITIEDVATLRGALENWTSSRAVRIDVLRDGKRLGLGPMTRVGGFKIRRRR